MERGLAHGNPRAAGAWSDGCGGLGRGPRASPAAPLAAVTVQVDVSVEALAELEEAAAWYEARSVGLGLEFVAEIDRAIAAIAERPLTFPR